MAGPAYYNILDTSLGDVVLNSTAIAAMLVAAPAALTVSSLEVDTGTKTASATTGAATLNKNSGQITSESLTTAAGAVYTLTLTDSNILATDLVLASVQYGTSTTGSPAITRVTPAAGSVVILVQNVHASAALNGTIIISFVRFPV